MCYLNIYIDVLGNVDWPYTVFNMDQNKQDTMSFWFCVYCMALAELLTIFQRDIHF